MNKRKIKKILLMQPNYGWLGKRTWPFPPYTLCLLKAVIGSQYETAVFDPNFDNMSEEEVVECLKDYAPDFVGVSSVSTEYFNVTRLLNKLIRQALPQAVIVYGGVVPTVLVDEVIKDEHADVWMMGEGEVALPRFIDELQQDVSAYDKVPGLVYRHEGKIVKQPSEFIQDLDSVPLPDYSKILGRGLRCLKLADYGQIKMKYAPTMLAGKYPYAMTITSRGCPYQCIFCAGRTVSGMKVRFRSAANVLKEIDVLYQQGIREVIFLDDHFLADKNRATAIMQGIIDRGYDMTWKCVNVTAWLLDKDIMSLMKKSGCSFLCVSIESGDQQVLKNIIKKPVQLDKIPPILDMAKEMGFDILANFVFGFPGETWDQIRGSVRYAEKLNVDIVNFHIATPLPKTELADICMKEGLLPPDYMDNIAKYSGYGKGLITTKEFTPGELEVLRSFEWDRINFGTPERRAAIARISGITIEELEDWRINTRRSLGVNSLVKNIMAATSDAGAKEVV